MLTETRLKIYLYIHNIIIQKNVYIMNNNKRSKHTQ